MSFKVLMTYKRILIRHIYTSVISWWCAFNLYFSLRHLARWPGFSVYSCIQLFGSEDLGRYSDTLRSDPTAISTFKLKKSFSNPARISQCHSSLFRWLSRWRTVHLACSSQSVHLTTWKKLLPCHCVFFSLKIARKNGDNGVFDVVNTIATFRVQTIYELDEACINADDRMMLVRHSSGDCVMSWHGFKRISEANHR